MVILIGKDMSFRPARRPAQTGQKVRRPAVTGQKARKLAVTSKYVARPTKVVPQYNRPSEEGAKEYNLLKREFNSLFGDYSADSNVIAVRRLTYKIGQLTRAREALFKRASQFKLTKTSVSFSAVAKIGASPQRGLSSLPLPKPQPLMSRYAARRDYTRAFREMQSQRAACLALVQAMAARRPRIIRRQKDQAVLVKSKDRIDALRALARERRYLQRHPAKEVKEFSFRGDSLFPEVQVEHEPQRDAMPKGVVRPTSVKQRKIKSAYRLSETENNLRNSRVIYRRDTSARISREEIDFLRFKLKMRVLARKDPQAFLSYFDEIMSRPVPQMDSTPEVQSSPSEQEVRSNVVITSAATSDRGPSHSIAHGYADLAVSLERQTIDDTTDRWIKVANYTWSLSNGQSINSILTARVADSANTDHIMMPGELLRNHRDSQNVQIMLVNRLYRPKAMKFKLVLNSSPFQTGALVIDWCYGRPEITAPVNNIYSALQRNHAIIQAGSVNNVELMVPYHHYNSYLALDKTNVSFGYVTLRVLVPLAAAENVAPQATLALYVAMEDVETHGFISRSIGSVDVPGTDSFGEPTGQMNAISSLASANKSIADITGVDVGATALNAMGSFFNRDNPPKPLQPLSLVPQTVPSFAYTDGVPEPLNVLRADPSGQRPLAVPTNEMDLLRLAKGWGYLATFPWEMKVDQGQHLWSTDVTPLMEPSHYPKVESPQTGIQACVYPPIAVASSFMTRYRGGLVYRFVPVMNGFMNGSITISAVPIDQQEEHSYKEVSRSYTQVMDIQKNMHLDFEVPWNWYNAWASVRGLYSRSSVFSRLYVKVLNPLIGVANVPTKVSIVVFVKAADNYELSLMRTPVLALSHRPVLPPATEYLIPYNKELAQFVGSSFRAKDTKGRYFSVMRISNVSDGFTGYTNVKPCNIYQLADRTMQGKLYRVQYKWNDGTANVHPVHWGVGLPDLKTSNAQGLAVFTDKPAAEALVKACRANQLNTFFDFHPQSQYVEDGPWSEVSTDGGKTWQVASNDGDHPVWVVTEQPQHDFEVIGQMDSNAETVVLERPAPSSSQGLRTYGEKTPDLKGAARRWEHYGSIVGKTCNSRHPRDCSYFAKIPVRPSREVNPGTSAEYDNRFGGGLINMLNGIYYLWEGGIRYTIVLEKTAPEDTVVYVQHRQDDNTQSTGIVIGSNPLSAKDMFDPHYATYMQALSVNPVLRVEVPYYSDHERLLSVPGKNAHNTNGYLYIYVHSAQSTDIQLEVYYSVADDFQWSVFQGTPGLIDITQIADEPKGQMDEEPIPQAFFATERRVLVDTATTLQQDTARLTTTVEEAAQNFSRLTRKFEEFFTTVTSYPSRLSQRHKTRMETDEAYANGMSFLHEMLEAGFDYMTHIIYCVISPTPGVIAWAIVNLYRNVFGFSFKGFSPLVDAIKWLWNKVTGPTQHPQGLRGQGEDDDQISSVCSVLFCSICSLTQIAVNPPTSWKDVTKGLFNFSNNCRAGSLVGKFFKDNVELLRRLWNKFVGYFSFGGNSYKVIAGIQDERLKKWCLHSTSLLSPLVREKILTHPLWAEKVFEHTVVGRAFQLAISQQKHVPSSLSRLVNDNMVGLKKLEQELVNRKVFCGERYEPYCLWVEGKAGTGKTRYLQDVATRLADMLQLPVAHTYHTITINQQYFDGFVGQPSIMIDDFLTTPPSTDPTAALFIQMKSSALFNPPYAIVDGKSTMVNFYNLLITSNFKEVGNLPGIHDQTAYNRRRDTVLCFVKRLKANYNFTIDELEALEHVDVYYYTDVINPTNKVLIPRVEGEKYSDSVWNFIKQQASHYHAREAESFKRRVQKKVERLERFATSGTSIEDYLTNCERLLSRPDADLNPDLADTTSYTSSLANWLQPAKPEVVEPEPEETSEPQGQAPGLPEEPQWPDYFVGTMNQLSRRLNGCPIENVCKEVGITNPAEYPVGEVIEPLLRSHYDYPKRKRGMICLHEAITAFDSYEWNTEYGYFERAAYCPLYDDRQDNIFSFPKGPCIFRSEKGIEKFAGCIMLNEQKAKKFREALAASFLKWNPDVIHKLNHGEPVDLEDNKRDCGTLPRDWYTDVINQHIRMVDFLANPDRRVTKIVENAQTQMEDLSETLGTHQVPKQSRWKTIPQKIWRGFIVFVKAALETTRVLAQIVKLITGLTLIGAIGLGAYRASKNHVSKRLDNEESELTFGQLHPSGDYKTLKNKGGARTTAMTLLRGENGGASDQDIVEFCKTSQFDPSSDGRLRAIIKNTFTLVGLAPLEGEHWLRYKVRCIGLKNNEFLVLKHYIDHFRSKGVTDVAIVYYQQKGAQRFKLDDIEFLWTKAGYGTGVFPTLAQPFRNIAKYIPSESFDGHYPTDMTMVEVGLDEVTMHSLNVTKLQHPKFIPAHDGQSPWTIEQGFTYSWGGPGKCESFLFCPRLACPLVGIHTAGVDTRVGYAEILLRETFVETGSLDLDFVIPNMDVNPDGTDLPGEGVCVGHLTPDKMVNIPSETKIQKSEIAGVFPIKTEPAPLKVSDPRLHERKDPLMTGVIKRCTKPLEFPRECLQTAFLDFCKVLRQVKPLRTLEPLSVKMAVEGLLIPGYEAMTISTSEGYPWSLDRPRGFSDKSWMFQFSAYPDGRRCLEGINPKLAQTIELKTEMCSRLVVPATYYTMMLKDARLPVEKVGIPGKTRVFEMSPVDLTIRQRQYFLDFYAAYQQSRLEAEHTVGINCDGPEWTDLAERLTAFSPHILTADYSGYGPTLLHSVLKKAIFSMMQWYDYHQEQQGIDEDEIDEQFRVRYSMCHEIIYPLHVLKDLVCQFPTGMDSGNAGTVIKNSCSNSLMIRVAYILIARDNKPVYADMYWFHQFVLMFSNGDDLIISVKPDIISWFNNETLIAKFAEFNIKMTDALKSGKTRPFCDITEATYLKRGFLPHPFRKGQWLAPLEEASITDTANWIWKCADTRAASLVNSEMCCRNAYSHGPAFYNRIVFAIEKAWEKKGVSFRAPSWESLDAHVWEGEEGPRFNF